MYDFFNQDLTVLIIALAVLTYLTRTLGYAVLAKFDNIHPRVEAALNAVPAAVITTLVVPPALTSGLYETVVLIVVALACIRYSPLVALTAGLLLLVALRGFTG